MLVIGITGGVGAGKTNILSYIGEHYNCEIILTDDLAKSFCKKGEVCYEPLVNLLSENVLDDDLQIDRRKMGGLIFNDEGLRKKVNEIIHPAVKKYITNRIAFLKESNEKDFLFIEAALLIEGGYKQIVDEMWYIYADTSVRAKRLKASRGYSDEKIEAMLKSQLSDDVFRQNSDFVIDNSGNAEDSFRQVSKRLKGYEYR